MSTLTALKLARELAITRQAMACPAAICPPEAASPGRPKLAMQWTVDPESGRPVTVWMEVRDVPAEAVTAEPAFD